MKKIGYSTIENLKYKRSKTRRLYVLFAGISLFITNIHLFYEMKDIKNAGVFVFTNLHSFLFMQVLFIPLLIGVITSKSVELEEQGSMLKVIISSGMSLSKLYTTKLFHIMKNFTGYVVFLWMVIITEISLLGFPCFTMPTRLLRMFFSFIAISYFIMIIHYNIAMITRNHLLNVALALLGSLLGFLSLFFMKFPVLPYSWYALISSVVYIRNADGNFSLELIDITLLPATISVLFFILLYIVGKKLFSACGEPNAYRLFAPLRRQYDETIKQ